MSETTDTVADSASWPQAERRSGIDRRIAERRTDDVAVRIERRSGVERRSGFDRRQGWESTPPKSD